MSTSSPPAAGEHRGGKPVEEAETAYSRARAAIIEAIRKGDFATARAKLAAARNTWPAAAGLRRLEGNLLEGTGDLDGAAAVYRALHAEAPDDAWAALQLVQIQVRLGRHDEARRVFVSAVAGAEVGDMARRTLLESLVADLDVAAARTFLEDIRTRDAALAADGERQLAQRERIAKRNLLARGARYEDALAVSRELLAERPDSREHLRKLILLLAVTGALDQAAEHLRTAFTRWPSDWTFIFQMNRLPFRRPVLESLFGTLEENRRSGALSGDGLFHYAAAALQVRRKDEADAALADISPEARIAHMADPLRAALSRWPDTPPTPRFDDDLSRELATVIVPDATTTWVVFPGLFGHFTYLPLLYPDALFARFPANVVYLRDNSLRGYLHGVKALGSDFAATCAALRAQLDDLGTKRLITLGSSIGGFAALRYGAHLGADTAVSLAGPTLLDPGDKERSSFNSAFVTGIPRDERDAVAIASKATAMKVYCCYGAESPRDIAQIARMQALPNVELRPMAGVNDHFVALHLIASGGFDDLLAECIGTRVQQTGLHPPGVATQNASA